MKNDSRCVGYVRVSVGLGLSVEQQETAIREAAQNKYHLVQMLVDHGRSAKNERRPAYQELKRMVQDDRVDVVLVTKLDRLSRNLRDLLNLLHEFRKHHVLLISLGESFGDTDTMIHLFGLMADWERQRISSRVRESKAYLRAQGKVYGPLPFGFRAESDRLVPDEAEMNAVRRIFKWRERGKGDAYIVKRLNRKTIQTRRGKPWHRMTVRAILKRRDLYRPYLKKDAKRMPHPGVLGLQSAPCNRRQGNRKT